MMLNDLLESDRYRGFEISETFDALKVEGRLDVAVIDFSEEILAALKLLSHRDSFELIIEANGNNIRILRTSDEDIAAFLSDLAEYDGSGDFGISLDVTKNTFENTTSVYSLNIFSKYLTDNVVDDVLTAWARLFTGNQDFEVFQPIEIFGTATVRFYPSFQQPQSSVEVLLTRSEKLELFAENATTVNHRGVFLPDDFHLTTPSPSIEITNFFARASSLHSLAFISNFSKLEGNKFSYKINGYKSIIANDIPVDQLCGSAGILYKIYDWAYSGGGNSDKVGLVRNMLSLHVDASGGVQFDRDVWEAIKSNYQIYLKRNIQSYLEVKNKLGEFIVESTSKTYALADQIIDSFKNNVLIILTFILTVVVINGLKDSGEVTVFSNAYLAIVVLLTVVSAVWLAFTRTEVLKRFDNASDTIKKVLKINYGQVLMDVEIDESIDPVVSINRAYMVEQISRYTTWWVAMLLVFLLSFGVCNVIFTQLAQPVNKGSLQANSSSTTAQPAIAPSPASSATVKAASGHARNTQSELEQGRAPAPPNEDKAGPAGAKRGPPQ